MGTVLPYEQRGFFCTMSSVPVPERFLQAPSARRLRGAGSAQGPETPEPSLSPLPLSPSQGCGSMRHRHGLLIPLCVLGAEGKSCSHVLAPHGAHQLPPFAQHVCRIQSSAPGGPKFPPPAHQVALELPSCHAEQTGSRPTPRHCMAAATNAPTNTLTTWLVPPLTRCEPPHARHRHPGHPKLAVLSPESPESRAGATSVRRAAGLAAGGIAFPPAHLACCSALCLAQLSELS